MMSLPALVADGGEMTVLRHVASHVYGAWDVRWPEGFTPPELDPDHELGFVHQLRDEEVPPFGRRFVRADVQIDAEVGTSTVEQDIDEVAARVAGETLFQRDITDKGLGRLKPGVDFEIGDVVPVRLWGRLLDLPVTAIDDMSTRGVITHRVHVGGQLIRDDAGRLQSNRTIERDIAAERRERRQQVGAVRVTAVEAKGTAEDASLTAGRLADPQRNVIPADADGRPFWTAGATRHDDDLPTGSDPTPTETTWTEYTAAASPNIPDAYVELSDKLDYKIGVWSKTPGTAHFRLVNEDGEDCILEWKQHRPLGDPWFPQESVVIAPDTAEWDRYEFVARLKPGTKAVRVLIDNPGQSAKLNLLELTVLSRTKEDVDALQSQMIEENRLLAEELSNTVQKIDRLQRIVIGNTHANVTSEVDTTELPTRGSFVELFRFTVAKDVFWDIFFEVGWHAAHHGSEYRLSVFVDGTERAWYSTTSLGPLFPWEDGFRRMSMTRANIPFYEGEVVSFHVRSSATKTSSRRVRLAYINMAEVI